MSTADTQLLLATADGDAAAAGELWSRFGGRLTAYAAAILRKHGGASAAQDTVQTVFCRILELDRAAIAQVNDAASWLLRAVRHTALNHIRGMERAAALRESRGLSSREGAGMTPGMRMRPKPADSSDELREVIEGLDEDLRELILLKHVAALTFDQMALSLEQNRNTIVSRYKKALEALRHALAEPPVLSVPAAQSGGPVVDLLQTPALRFSVPRLEASP